MKSEYLKVGNTYYHMPTVGPLSFKNFKKMFPDLRGMKEIYDLIYLEYHGKPNDNKSKGSSEPVVEIQEQPTDPAGDSELVVSE